MTTEKTMENERVKGVSSAAKPRLSALAYQILVLALGLFISISMFMGVHNYVRGLSDGEYDRIGLMSVKNIAGHFSELEAVIGSVSGALSLEQGAENSNFSANIERLFPNVNRFDQILRIYQTPDQSWRVANVYTRGDDGRGVKRYGLNVDREFLSYILKKDILSSAGVRVLTDLSFTARANQPDVQGVHSAPFALAMPLGAADAGQSFVIAVASMNNVLDAAWLEQNKVISELSVRELASGHPVFTMVGSARGINSRKGKGLTYEFTLGGDQWEVVSRFARLPQAAFLSILPIFMLVLGFASTALAVLYLRSKFDREAEVEAIEAQLARKNLALKTEAVERARLNEVLEKSTNDHRSIIDAVSDVIFETNIKGEIVFLSARWRKVTGFDPDQSKGLDLFSMLHADDQDRLRDDFRQLVDGQKQSFRSFTRLRTANGRFRAVELAVSLMRRDQNKKLRVVGTFTDVEERRRAERALGEAERKYRAIVENAAGGIFQITPEGLYLSANPALARILGYDSPEAILRTVKNANEEVYASVRERQIFLKEIEKKGVINNYETRVIRKDGEVIWVNENVRVVRDDSRNTLYYEGSVEDITERKETDIKLREAKMHSDLANRAKSEFLANMSHELRTPLNAIIGFSEIIKNEAFGKIEPNSYWEYAKDIHESGGKLLNVINEILDISRIEAGERQLNENVIDLNKIVDACVDLMGNKIDSSKLIVSVDLDDTPDIVGEELAVKQVIMNLLSNAVKFTPHGGRVTVSSNVSNDGRLHFSITDTGIGLDDVDIQKALSPFGQLQNDLSRSNSGTGLGLTLADALVKLHGGDLELFSQKGIGTTATIIFPKTRVCVKKEALSEGAESDVNEAEQGADNIDKSAPENESA